MEALRIAGVDCSFGCAELCGVIQPSHLQNKGFLVRDMCAQMGAAGATEATGDGVVQVRSGKFFGLLRGPGQACGGQKHEVVGPAAANILAFSAVALCFKHRLPCRDIPHSTAITAAFETWCIRRHSILSFVVMKSCTMFVTKER